MYKFGKVSLERLSTCDVKLQMIAQGAIERSPIDFGIAQGYRSLEDQKKAFNEGKSRIDGVTKKGKHNYNPSKALDFYAFVNGKASWNHKELCLIAGIMFAVAYELGIPIRWGGNWDGDGVIISDQNLIDLPHIELL